MASDTTLLPAQPPEDVVRASLGRVLCSQVFARSQRQQQFLRYAVEAVLEGRQDTLKEAVLGVEVFGRGPGFDSRADNIVRVEARRLRQRLEEYYRTQGLEEPVRIEFPVGSYVPQIAWRVPPRLTGPVELGAAAPVRPGYFRLALAAAALVLLTAAIATLLWVSWNQPASVAVLPFADYSAGGAEQYRTDGISEDITQFLAEVPNLRVVARTSAFRFRGRGQDVAEIGRRLNVRALLEGSVQRDGERFRIAARLVNVRDGFEVWSTRRETDASGMAAAERAIAAGAAAALGAGLPRPESKHQPLPEAQDLLLRARFLAAQPGPDSRRRALELYQRATGADPEYARAWGEMARLMSLIAFHDDQAAPQLERPIREAAERAIRLEDSYSDPHFALARLAWVREWNFSVAEREFERALEINPNSAAIHQAYALALASRGRHREAVTHSRRAIELDPLSFAASNDLGAVLYLAGRFDEAVAHARKSLALSPESAIPRFLLGTALAGRGEYAAGAAELEKVILRLGRAPELLGRLGYAQARGGQRDRAQALLAEMERDSRGGRIYQAMIHAGLGDGAAALRELEQSAARKETDFLFFGADPVWQGLQREPRLQALRGRLGLPAHGAAAIR